MTNQIAVFNENEKVQYFTILKRIDDQTYLAQSDKYIYEFSTTCGTGLNTFKIISVKSRKTNKELKTAKFYWAIQCLCNLLIDRHKELGVV